MSSSSSGDDLPTNNVFDLSSDSMSTPTAEKEAGTTATCREEEDDPAMVLSGVSNYNLNNEGNNGSNNNNTTSEDEWEKKKQQEDQDFTKETEEDEEQEELQIATQEKISSEDIAFIIDTMKKEAQYDGISIKQLF